MKIANGVEMLEISVDMMGSPTIIYPVLTFDNDNVILIDTGYPEQLGKFQEAIEGAGIHFNKLNRIILTHQDIDHIGGISSIVKALPHNIEVISHGVEKPYIEGTKTPVKLERLEATLNSLPPQMQSLYEKLKSGFKNSYAKVDKTIEDGEELPYCGGISVIYTPGHTPGHVCLYLEQSKTLVAGDMLSIKDGMLVKSPASINYDEDLYAKSLKKLTEYAIETIVCYHGGPFRDNPKGQILKLLG